MSRIVSSLQVEWFRCQRQGPIRTTKKVRRWRNSGSFAWRFGSTSRTDRDIIQHHPLSRFSSIASYGKEYEVRKATVQILHVRFQGKIILHRIIIGYEKWVYYDNPKCMKSWVSLRYSETSIAKLNIQSKVLVGEARHTVLRASPSRRNNGQVVKKWIDRLQTRNFFYGGIHKVPCLWKSLVTNDRNYFYWKYS